MQLIETHIVEKLEKPIRFQEYSVGIFNTIPTKSGIKKAIKKGLIFIEGSLATTSKYISGGEKIELFESENSSTFERLKLYIEVLFEDETLAVVYKPAGILVSGNKFVTIANGLAQNLKKSTLADAVKPQPIHRLDYPTSGLLLIGKTSTAITALGKLFKEKEIQKTYFAVTIGKMNSEGTIKLPIDKKESKTDFKVLHTVISERFEFLNLVKLSPKTGRKHQLRKHLFSLENPILGDKEYFLEGKVLNGKGLYLHAATLDFVHPFTKKTISISKELPKKFNKIFKELSF
ncbi:RluA family pseudouridine synthase [Polaribacter sp. R2A056_3_33]|uniref:RluA family pseudouridine synthase n=1 Tax=Polaribacter sp. R2A056_3_33 TaxID=2745563 RepID=UPI001C4F3171|nr:RluA family pseudouridine synthase [Polaribacter sp. R2A056_3_33]QXP69399.1 RluA family pseudouridine synthase [Polaribacter sp. R2A056_3_33]